MPDLVQSLLSLELGLDLTLVWDLQKITIFDDAHNAGTKLTEEAETIKTCARQVLALADSLILCNSQS
ncbi:hypothetical protein CEXT_93011 [Caerostris extrusa]|uniref:Uncharacterized protein n=1 Tax=Caerostris extrusa TaxID=172846 RepID=A0AAV4N0C2_CAEEX|nr:hypothetical protein CEXT_93011 [Caerostris extrusa]